MLCYVKQAFWLEVVEDIVRVKLWMDVTQSEDDLQDSNQSEH